MWCRIRRFLPNEAAVVNVVHRNTGFTLLEVMIAVAIIAIAVVTLLGAQSQSVSIAASARSDTMASMLAQWKMSDLMLQDFDQIADDEGNFGEDYPHYSWKLRVSELTEGETGIIGTAQLLKALDITVQSSQGYGMDFALRTFVYRGARQKEKTTEGAKQPPTANGQTVSEPVKSP